MARTYLRRTRRWPGKTYRDGHRDPLALPPVIPPVSRTLLRLLRRLGRGHIRDLRRAARPPAPPTLAPNRCCIGATTPRLEVRDRTCTVEEMELPRAPDGRGEQLDRRARRTASSPGARATVPLTYRTVGIARGRAPQTGRRSNRRTRRRPARGCNATSSGVASDTPEASPTSSSPAIWRKLVAPKLLAAGSAGGPGTPKHGVVEPNEPV